MHHSSLRDAARLLALLAAGALACRAPDANDGASARRAPRRTATDTLWFVQGGAFPDSARAVAVADSLRTEGWSAFASPRMSTTAGFVWRVRLLPTRSRELAELALQTARVSEGPVANATLGRAVVPEDVDVFADELTVVNGGSHGMSARVRWQVSDDRRALFVVEDPAAVEAEPVPNGAVLANEATGTLLQVQHVWDAAPSPDWTRLAVSWAFVLQGGESQNVSLERWAGWVNGLPETFARQLDTVRGSARNARIARLLQPLSFNASGMGVARGLGFGQVVRADRERGATLRFANNAPPDERLLRLDTWRVRWMRNGNLALGTGVRGTQDFSPPERWIAVRPDSGRPLGILRDTLSLAPVRWVDGPTITAKAVESLPAGTVLDADLRRFDTRNGWVRVIENQRARVLGPGVPLVATRTGRFVAALVPLAAADDGQPLRLVVYRVP